MKTQTIYIADKDKLIEPEGSGTPSVDPSESASQLYTRIAQQPFFQGLSAPHLQLLADSALEMQFEPGQWLFREGDPANRFHLILEGKVILEADAKDRGLIPIQTVGPGEDLGWSWLLPPFYLHLSARALEQTRTIFFYGTRLPEQCEQDHDLGFELMKRIAGVVVQRLRATQQRLVECADSSKFSTLPGAA